LPVVLFLISNVKIENERTVPVQDQSALHHVFDEMMHQSRDVLGPGPERGDRYGEYVEPEPEIFPEPAIFDHLLEVAVGCCDDPDIHRYHLGSAHALHFPVLQHPEQSDLGLGRQLADFVEKDGTAVGPFKTPPLPGEGPGNPVHFPLQKPIVLDQTILKANDVPMLECIYHRHPKRFG
jgi:hypothetical protein